jgi:PAS domain S-box-containing protein
VAVDQEQLIGHAAEGQRAEEALRRLNRTLRTISECNQAVVRATAEPELLEAVCRIAVECGGYRLAWVGLTEADEAKSVRPVAHAGLEEGYLDLLHITYADTERGRGTTGTAIRERRVFTIRDILSDPRFVPWRDDALKRGYASVIALPLFREEEVFGALTIYSARTDAFDVEEESLLNELARNLAYGITALRTRAERERAEEALHASETRFRELFNNMTSGVAVYEAQNDGRDFVFRDFNRAAERIEATPREAVLGRSVVEVFPGVRNFGLLDVFQRVWQTGQPEHYPAAVYHDERIVGWRENSVYKLPSGEIVAVYDDVTERKQAEAALRESEERLSLALEAARMGTWDLNFVTGKLIWSRGHEELWGYTPGTFRGTFEEFDQRLHPDDRSALYQTGQQAFAAGAAYTHEYRVLWPDGSVHWIHDRGRPYPDATGKTVRTLGVAMDITERKRAEEALRLAEERYRSLVENLNDVIFVLDLQGTLTYISPAIQRISDYRPEELMGQPFRRFIHPDNLPVVRASFADVLAGRLQPLEYRALDKQGRVVHIRSSSRPRFENGRLVGITGVITDVTERKQAEEALRESEERLRLAVAGADLGTWHWNLRTGELFWSDRSLAMSGFPPGTPVSYDKFLATMHPDDRARVDATVQRALQEGSEYDIEYRNLWPDGTVHWAASKGRAYCDDAGQPLRMEGVALDITRRKLAEAATRRERDFSEAALNSLPGVLYVFHQNLKMLRWNKNLEQVLGYTGAEISRMSPLDFFAEPDKALALAAIQEVFATGASHVEADVVAKDGTRTPYYFTGLATRIDGKLCLIGTGIDISQRKQAAEEQTRLQAALRHSEMMAAMGALVAGVAHEARNPLFGISATLDAFEARFGQQPQSAQYLAVLRGEANRLNGLMRDLLAYGRPPSPMLVPGSIVTVIAEAVAACAPLAREADVQVAMTTAEEIAPLAIDAGRLPQVFQNLLQNAIQQSPRGGTVTVEAAEASDDSRVWIECTVKDSGPGFREEDLPQQIFEPFFSHRTGGTGLGLSIVERIVADHRGTVAASNRPEGGAVVTVRLPAAA